MSNVNYVSTAAEARLDGGVAKVGLSDANRMTGEPMILKRGELETRELGQGRVGEWTLAG